MGRTSKEDKSMKPPMLKDVKKTKPRLKSVTYELPGGWSLQTTEPDGENTYSEEQIDEAVREIAKPLIQDLLTQLEKELIAIFRDEYNNLRTDVEAIEEETLNLIKKYRSK
jgi:hypothetical protein